VATTPDETLFLAAAAARVQEALAGLSGLAVEARRLPRLAAWGLGVAGLLLLVVGARRRHVIGLVGGAAVGAVAGLVLHSLELWPGLSRFGLVAAGGVALGLLGALVPPVFAFAAGALPGAVLGAEVAIGVHHGLGLLAGALALGALSLAMARVTAAAVSGVLGAALLGAAILQLLGDRPLAGEMATRPAILVGWLLVVGLAGAALQYVQAGSERARGGRGAATPPEDPAARSPE